MTAAIIAGIVCIIVLVHQQITVINPSIIKENRK